MGSPPAIICVAAFAAGEVASCVERRVAINQIDAVGVDLSECCQVVGYDYMVFHLLFPCVVIRCLADAGLRGGRVFPRVR